MNYGMIKRFDIANGRGVRTSLFVSGCTHHCNGCFQPETWDFGYGRKYTEETEKEILKYLSDDVISGITILGGEPFEPENQMEVLHLVKAAKQLYPDKDIWIYSGYTFNELHDKNKRCFTEITENILELIDVLVDGEFHLDEKDISLHFRGSSNQRIIDVKKSIKSGEIQLVDIA